MLPKIGSYGKYSGGNYGAHALYMELPGFGTLFYSYSTIIAFYTEETGLLMRENEWGPTTGRHMNMISRANRIRLTGAEFEARLKGLLEQKGMA